MKTLILCTLTLFIVCSCKNNGKISDAYGNFEVREILISSESSGMLLLFKPEEGMNLKSSEIVAIVDTIQLYLKLKQLYVQKTNSTAKTEGINATVLVQEQQQKNLLKEKDRFEKLVKDEAVPSKQLDDINDQIDVINQQINSTKTQLNLVKSEAASTDVQIEQVKDQIARCKIKNPIEGTVLETYVEQSELISAGRNLYKIADLENMELRVYVSGDQLPKLKIGQKVNVLIDRDKEQNTTLDGEVSWVSQTAEFTPKIIQTKEERVNLVYAVKIKVKNDGSIKIGMPGEVVF